MCNLYSHMTNQEAIRNFVDAFEDKAGNLQQYPGIYPDYAAPIIRNAAGGRELVTHPRWGMPSSKKAIIEAAQKRAAKLEAKGKPYDFNELLKMEPDGGTTNIRNTNSQHWKRWLGVENRCLVPFTSFAEPGLKADGTKGNVWFRPNDAELAFFAGVWTNWTGVRKIKEGMVTIDIYAFLTTEPNAEVGAVHPKAMPAILRTREEIETWMTASWEVAKALQRPLLDNSLTVASAAT